jgi:flagellar motor protein MotB
MAGLLVIFILALVTLMIQQKISVRKSEEAQAEAVEKSIEAEEEKKRAEEAEKRSMEVAAALEEETAKNKKLRQQIIAGVVKLSEIEKIRVAILNEISERLRSEGIKVEISDNSTVLRIPEDTLAFETAKWSIPSKSGQSLGAIGEAVHDAITKDDRLAFLDTIFVEGHTDSVPLQREMGNWGLSTYRAISVWQHWENHPDKGSLLADLKNHDGKPVFSVSGYGDTRRVVDKDVTEELRRRNRRIDLRFTMKSVERTDLQKLIDRFQQK